MRRACLLGIIALGGCGLFGDGDGGSLIKAPSGDLASIELVRAPDLLTVLAWQCSELQRGVDCEPLGPRPRNEELAIAFDLDFDLDNPNVTVPIPLTEALVGVTLFDTGNLDATCITLCDPADETCQAGVDAEGGCAGGSGVLGPDDLVPTVPDLLSLSEEDDGTYVNDEWRTLRGGDTTRVTMGFDLDQVILLGLDSDHLTTLLDDVLDGGEPTLTIPFTVEGTLYVDVPDLGRRAVGFGPSQATWTIEIPKTTK